MTAAPPPGWYEDRQNTRLLRYWDGAHWTAHTAPAGAGTDMPPPPGTEARERQPGVHAARKVTLLTAKATIEELQAENEELRTTLERFGAFEIIELERQRDELAAQIQAQKDQVRTEAAQIRAALEDLHRRIAEAEGTLALQEVGLYARRYDLDSPDEYETALAEVRQQYVELARMPGGAVTATSNWEVNGSAAEGHRFVTDLSRLALRVYNAEADALLRDVTADDAGSAAAQLAHTFESIQRLGAPLRIAVTGKYHRLRSREINLKASRLAAGEQPAHP